jgi:predicted lipoprotein
MPARRPLVCVLAVAGWLAIDRPWTIRPIERAAAGPFDAAAYVAGIWDSRVVPEMRSLAVPFAAWTNAPAPSATAAVSLAGVVIAVDSSSRVGTAAVDVDPADGRADALLAVGPVVRGTALRDALDFIRFSDFTNQIQYASVAGALNERALAVLPQADAETLRGRRIQSIGAASKPASPNALPVIVPVALTIEERP